MPLRKELSKNAMSYENGNKILLCDKSFGGAFFEGQNDHECRIIQNFLVIIRQ